MERLRTERLITRRRVAFLAIGVVALAVAIVLALSWHDSGSDPSRADRTGSTVSEVTGTTSARARMSDAPPALDAEQAPDPGRATSRAGANARSRTLAESSPPASPKRDPDVIERRTGERDERPAHREPMARRDDDATPRLTISGRVYDDLGIPVPALEIVGRPRHLFDDDANAELTGIDREQTAYTDFYGTYTFYDLPDGEYDVYTVQTELYASAHVLARAGNHAVDLVVPRQAELLVHGTVSGGDRGVPLQGVRVRAVGRPESATTNVQGRFELWLLIKSTQSYQTLRFQANGYQVHEIRLMAADWQDRDSHAVDVALTPIVMGVRVEGTVTSAAGGPIAGETVHLYSPSRKRRHASTTNPGGRFFFDRVEVADDYRLWIRPREDYHDYNAARLRVGEEGLALDIALEPLAVGGLSGRIVNLEGQPVPGFSIWVRSMTAATRRVRITSDDRGYYSADDIPAGNVVLETRSFPVHRLSGVRIEPGVRTVQDIVVNQGQNQINGRIVSAYGEPIPGAQITVFWAEDQSGLRTRATRQVVADVGGYFFVPRLAAGRYMLNVHALGFTPARVDHVVSPHAADVEVALQELSQ